MSKVIYFMKILITGAKGQLGQELVRLSLVFPNGEIVGFDRKNWMSLISKNATPLSIRTNQTRSFTVQPTQR